MSSPVIFKPTPKQERANELLNNPQIQHVLLYGGSRSGKTFLICRAQAWQAIMAPRSRHCALRFRLAHVRESIMMDTFPKMMRLCFPKVKYELNKAELLAQFENGSEYWFGGLDDKERVEKILGKEFASIFLNECSQIPWASRNIALTRLAQAAHLMPPNRPSIPLPLHMYYDENPPDKGHWTYRLFRLQQDPESRRPLADPDNYISLQMNPKDNEANLPAEYLKTLRSLSARLQKRFLEGEFGDLAPNALFRDEILDQWRVDAAPHLLRIVVAVDPSGSDDEDNIDNDEIGIIVAGLGSDGNAYVLEDLTCKCGPATWGKIATNAYERWEANSIVAEVNYGGAMVKHVIHTARPKTPFRPVTASRGKCVRAEPVAALAETGQLRLVGIHRQLEDELVAFTTYGFTGENSPNRADAMIWAVSDLFPQLFGGKDKQLQPIGQPKTGGAWRNDNLGWMGS